ncbi:hypothetical protein T4D_10930 [Trichinella pseudospiralis]|uniref:Uncharacterized protein n=1 Tax=Trichinella pseudospiralis TaxID=6337 RepID=A0A0V1G5M5_TRIPS|nr:hypothetical protein T4D_10930 [Trichinella pseudospiralis]
MLIFNTDVEVVAVNDFERVEPQLTALILDNQKNLTIDYSARLNSVLHFGATSRSQTERSKTINWKILNRMKGEAIKKIEEVGLHEKTCE